MAKPEKPKDGRPSPEPRPSSKEPLVFISHDSRDADLAEAFSKLLKSISAGMLKSFRSSDRKGSEGIEFGDEWYQRLMTKLESASDVVCLFTERSLDRPWILYEAGVAKGRLNTTVQGIALGVPLSRPFYQFHNSDDSNESLTKLVLQIARRVPGLDPDSDVVSAQVEVFKSKVSEVVGNIQQQDAATIDEAATAKLFEEVKVMFRDLPSRVEDRLEPSLRRRRRRFHPMMIEDMLRMSESESDPTPLLVIFSLFRDEFPWMYDLGREIYEALRRRSRARLREAMTTFHRVMDFSMRHPMMEELFIHSKEAHMMMRELPRIIDRHVERTMHRGKQEESTGESS
jgi:hypothetical protein